MCLNPLSRPRWLHPRAACLVSEYGAAVLPLALVWCIYGCPKLTLHMGRLRLAASSRPNPGREALGGIQAIGFSPPHPGRSPPPSRERRRGCVERGITEVLVLLQAALENRHRLNGYSAQRVPSICLASSFRICLINLRSSQRYVSLEDGVPIKLGTH